MVQATNWQTLEHLGGVPVEHDNPKNQQSVNQVVMASLQIFCSYPAVFVIDTKSASSIENMLRLYKSKCCHWFCT